MILGVIFMFGVPSLVLATRFALRPLVRDVAEAIRTTRPADPADAALEARVARIEETVRGLDRHVDRLLEAERFRRELESGERASASAPPDSRVARGDPL